MLENLLVGVASSLVASLLFIAFLYQLRPNVVVAPEIAKLVRANEPPRYTFKLVNRSPYPAVDLRVEVLLYSPRNIANGQINDVTVLAKFERFELESPKKLSEPFGNELWLTYGGALESQWNDDRQHLTVLLIGKHSLSQFSRVFAQRFYRKGVAIKLGQFANGPSLSVVAEA